MVDPNKSRCIFCGLEFIPGQRIKALFDEVWGPDVEVDSEFQLRYLENKDSLKRAHVICLESENV